MKKGRMCGSFIGFDSRCVLNFPKCKSWLLALTPHLSFFAELTTVAIIWPPRMQKPAKPVLKRLRGLFIWFSYLCTTDEKRLHSAVWRCVSGNSDNCDTFSLQCQKACKHAVLSCAQFRESSSLTTVWRLKLNSWIPSCMVGFHTRASVAQLG